MELSPYQVKAMERLLAKERYGLFDEMGLGKTAVAVEATVRSAQFPCLVTAPAYLLGNWRREILAWQPNAQVAVADGERPRRQAVYESNADFILSTYNAWHSYPVLTKRKWGRYVFDEAHRMRGRNSQWTKAVFKTQNVESKNRNTPFWDLTGTPLVRDGGDLWPFLHRIDRQMFRSYWSFVERHCHVEVTPWDRVIGRLINPREFAELMSRYSIRRMASTIPELADLEHITTTIKVDMPPSVLKAMREARKTYVLDHPDMASPLDFDSGGALVTKLRQMATLPPTASKPKIEAMLGKLEDSGNERCVVWCWFRDSAEYAAEAIRKQRKHVYVVHGGTAPSKVDEAFIAYNENPDAVIVATISKLKEGANLQAGRRCIFLEASDLPGDNYQAIARQKRRGQKQKVLVTKILADKTIDTIQDRLIGKRWADINGVDISRELIREIHREYPL